LKEKLYFYQLKKGIIVKKSFICLALLIIISIFKVNMCMASLDAFFEEPVTDSQTHSNTPKSASELMDHVVKPDFKIECGDLEKFADLITKNKYNEKSTIARKGKIITIHRSQELINFISNHNQFLIKIPENSRKEVGHLNVNKIRNALIISGVLKTQ